MTTAYAEFALYGAASATWIEEEPEPWPPRLSGKRCGKCRYLTDALGHLKNCGRDDG